MWDDRTALADLDIPDHSRILDVGCGTGSLTRVLREEAASHATVVGLDADAALLSDVEPPTIRGDATRLPIGDGAGDLVACQALLVNMSDPVAVLEEFARVSRGLVAVIEPDNAAVSVESTVPEEETVTARARQAYVAGVETDVTLGSSAAASLREAGLRVRSSTVHLLKREITPPYTDEALEGARRKLQASQIEEAEAILRAGGLDEDEYADLAAEWRTMGRAVVKQMNDGRYRRTELVPFHVVVAQVSG
jgi:SAM-dependent methyltransferase